jgi:hypothetical protein
MMQHVRDSRCTPRHGLSFLVAMLGSLVLAEPADAWIFPEHRDIAVLAVQGLDPEHRSLFDSLWQDARTGDDQRLCAQGADAGQGLTPECIDWAALSGIAGDHSCSSAEMLETVRASNWILQVADVAAQLKADLARIPVTAPPGPGEGASTALGDAQRRLADVASRAARLNALRTADIRLQRADPQYATRADSNQAHFLMPRPDTALDPYAQGQLALSPGAELNAAGVYTWFHLSALQKAGRLANEPQLTPEERRLLARSALFDEAFALHFLEDMFAAGHVAGSWGDVSQRKGTHDYYNENGLEVFTWKGRDRTVVLMGDAHMRPQDAALAADTVRISLEQVLDASVGRSRGSRDLPQVAEASTGAESFDVCRTSRFPQRPLTVQKAGPEPYRSALEETLLPTPVPGLGPGLGAQPRSRSEVGAFMGLAGSIGARALDGGFLPSQTENGFRGGIELAFRFGLGLDGALGDAGDGLVYAQLGFRADSPSTNKFSDTGLATAVNGSLTAAIPSQTGLSGRIRMPFYLLPGDLLLLSPLYLVNRDAYMQMAVTAVNGGLVPWQQGWATRFGRFQFVLGRELGVTFHGFGEDSQILVPSTRPDGLPYVINLKSTSYDLPILECRPFRAFSNNQSSSVIFQLFIGAEVPYGASALNPGVTLPDLHTVWSLGLRMVHDWRYYF